MNPPPSYLKDASRFSGKADAVLFPDSEEQIAQILRDATQKKIPVTIAGAGTGLTGGRVPNGGILISMERMNRILKIEWDEKAGEGFVIVEPGVTLQTLEETLEKQGLFYPPNPGEKKAFIGGTVATNASGSRSLKYGATRAYVKRLRIILSTGELLDVSRGAERAERGLLQIACPDGRQINAPVPTYSMPLTKNSAGYYAAPNMDAIDLFIGSEGTLGVFTQIKLKIITKPEAFLSGIFFFPSEKVCFLFSKQARRCDPRALEFFDSRSLALLRQKHPNIPRTAQAALFFEQECQQNQKESIQQEWLQEAERFKMIEEVWSASEFRYHLPVLVNEQVERNGFRKIGTDMAVPEPVSEEMFDFYFKTLERSGIDWVLFGHIGDNHLHANLLPKTDDEFKRAEEIYGTLAQKAISLGGTISAEHGIGKIRILYLKMMVGDDGLKQMARVKLALDPAGILNRGNIIPDDLLPALR